MSVDVSLFKREISSYLTVSALGHSIQAVSSLSGAQWPLLRCNAVERIGGGNTGGKSTMSIALTNVS